MRTERVSGVLIGSASSHLYHISVRFWNTFTRRTLCFDFDLNLSATDIMYTDSEVSFQQTTNKLLQFVSLL